jgi:hypothetical protein
MKPVLPSVAALFVNPSGRRSSLCFFLLSSPAPARNMRGEAEFWRLLFA